MIYHPHLSSDWILLHVLDTMQLTTKRNTKMAGNIHKFITGRGLLPGRRMMVMERT